MDGSFLDILEIMTCENRHSDKLWSLSPCLIRQQTNGFQPFTGRTKQGSNVYMGSRVLMASLLHTTNAPEEHNVLQVVCNKEDKYMKDFTLRLVFLGE